MGTINKGILGPFSGIVGTVVGGTWNGISYMRSKPGPRKGAPTPAQLTQQARFTTMVKYLQPLAGLLALSFRDAAIRMSGFNLAVQHNLESAITGAYPDFAVDPAQLLLSRGALPNAMSPAAASTVAGQLSFTWKDNSGMGKAVGTDQALLVAYSSELNQAVYTTLGGLRSAQTAILAVAAFSGVKVDSYISFLSQKGRVSNSVYTGAVTIL